MRTSIRMISGIIWDACWRASSPLEVATTSCPAKRRVNATSSRISGSSSAIKILAMKSPLFSDGQGEGEHAALACDTRTFHPDASILHFNQLADNGQAQSGTRGGED